VGNRTKYLRSPSPVHPVQLYFYSARRPLPFRRYFSRYPGNLYDKNKSIHKSIQSVYMTMDDDDVGRREVNMNKSSLKKILTPSQSQLIPVQLYFL
jgi:hypothetical protein